jgi:hypothetical protein
VLSGRFATVLFWISKMTSIDVEQNGAIAAADSPAPDGAELPEHLRLTPERRVAVAVGARSQMMATPVPATSPGG